MRFREPATPPCRGIAGSYGEPVTTDDARHGEPNEWPYQGLAEALARPLAQTGASNVTAEQLVDEVTGSEPPPLAPGRLRPYVAMDLARTARYGEVLDRALKLLLYAPEVVTDRPWLSVEPEDQDETLETITSLVNVWDLVVDGSLHIREMPHPLGQYASYGNPDSLRLDTPEVVDQFAFTGRERDHWLDQAVAMELWPRRTTPWFISDRQASAMDSLLQSAGRSLDGRGVHLPALAALKLPSMALRTPELIAVRRSSDTFAEWRQQLRTALEQVQLLPESETWQADARAVIADELTPYTERLRGETSRSSALSASVTGMKQLVITGLGGAVGGLAGGSTAGALAGLGGVAAGTFISGLSDWVRVHRAAAPQRAVLKLAVVFDDGAA